MLAVKHARTSSELLVIIDGAVVDRGTQGTNTSGSPNFSDPHTDAFVDVQEGDQIWISGIATSFTVQTKTDVNNLVLSANITPAHTGDGVWVARRGGIGGTAAVLFGGPFSDNSGSGAYDVFYNATTFGS